MACCGSKAQANSNVAAPGYGFTPVRWEGSGSIKALGGTTNRTYRFNGYGSVVAIDDKDLSTVTAIPRMRIVR